MPGLPRNRTVATAAAALGLLGTAVPPAHAVNVTVPLPQTPVQVPQTQITAPGADVTVGPGGASVNVDPQKAIGGVTGPTLSPPPSPPPPQDAQTSTNASPQAGGGSSPGPGGSNGGDRISPGLGARPSEGRTGAGERTRGAAGAARSAPSGAAGTSGSATPAGDRRSRAGSGRRAGADERPAPGVVRQVIEKIPQELLGLLLVLALFGAAMSLVWLRERGQVRAARRLAQVDPLTGIPNRLAFEYRLADEWKRARRYERPLGLLLLDLDGLKTVNDRDGHEAGDRMIQAAARQIAEDIRQSDMPARLAGDEFVVLCPETPGEGVERLGAKLARLLDGAGIGASIGAAEVADTDIGPNDLLARADAAMYEEKARRRGSSRERAKARPGVAIAG